MEVEGVEGDDGSPRVRPSAVFWLLVRIPKREGLATKSSEATYGVGSLTEMRQEVENVKYEEVDDFDFGQSWG